MMIMQSFNKLGIILAFRINQDYIASALCENRDKPEMHCNGRCVLAKKLKQAEQNEEKQRAENQQKAHVLFFCKMNRLELTGLIIDKGHLRFNPFYLKFKPSIFVNDIFKPPQEFIA
ncbi:hypothetical protein PBAL39_03339 [Pedobacter sp. BAL39]|nr:hypothetical protein PBAL39_03339 [Pedobacter sp. BAL39]